MSRLAPRPLEDALAQLAARLRPATTLARVQAVWPSAAGGQVAAHAAPTAERDGVLTITCEASVWAQELDLMSADLIAALNAALGSPEIRELRCRTG